MKNKLVYAGKIDNVLAMLKLDITLAKLNQKLLQGEQTPTLKTYLQNKNFWKTLKKLLTSIKTYAIIKYKIKSEVNKMITLKQTQKAKINEIVGKYKIATQNCVNSIFEAYEKPSNTKYVHIIIFVKYAKNN